MKRHIGKIKNTDQRCVVVFMQIPGREDHALVVNVEGLPPRVEQALMEIVESREGQAEATLGNVLSRRILPDTGDKVLDTLHNRGLLRAVHIDTVIMLPLPNMPFPLRHVIEQIGNVIPGPIPSTADSEKFNPHAVNTSAMSSENRLNIARNLLAEASLLEQDTFMKREKAYNYAPELRPAAQAPVAPQVTNVTNVLNEVVDVANQLAAEAREALNASEAPKATRRGKTAQTGR